MPSVFSVPIFFIVFRESLEASIIVSVLLALVETIAYETSGPLSSKSTTTHEKAETEKDKEHESPTETPAHELANPTELLNAEQQIQAKDEAKLLIKKMRIQVFIGSGLGFFIALAIGAAFLAVWFTQLNDIYGKNEEIWEGTFDLVACLLIFVMGLTMLRIDKAKAKWRVKLHQAFFSDSVMTSSKWAKWNPFKTAGTEGLSQEERLEVKGSKWTLFLLPFITVLREGLEAVVFIGGISLGQPATAIPLATICGLICGLGVGFIIYKSSSTTSISFFLVLSTNLLLLVGAGLFSKAVGCFERNKFNKIVGADVSELGSGPGSFDVRGNIWHLDCCNPEDNFGNGGWSIFAGLFGWSNNGSLGTVLSYIFYWVAATVALVVMQITGKKTTRNAHSA